MAPTNDSRENGEQKEMEKKWRSLLEKKKMVFPETKEADKELLKIRQQETAVQNRLQELKETERMRWNAYLKATLQSRPTDAMAAFAFNSESEIERLETEMRRTKQQFAVCEPENKGKSDVNSVTLEALRHRNDELSAALRKVQEDNLRITDYSKTQQQMREEAMREVAKLKDEIMALRQISDETQQRQLSEIQSTSPAPERLQQHACRPTVEDHADVLRAMYDKVSSTIDAQSVARSMFQSNALTLKELQSIQSKHSEPVRSAEDLLNIVMNQSGNVYSCFLDALKNTGHQNMFDVIVSDSYKDFDAQFEHTHIIRQHYLFLVDILDSKHSGLVCELYQAEVLSREEMESVNCEVMSFRQNEKLLSMLSRKTKDQFDKFLSSLDKTGQQHVCNYITGRQHAEDLLPEVPTQQEDVFGAYLLQEQQLKEANDTIASLKEQLKRLQLQTNTTPSQPAVTCVIPKGKKVGGVTSLGNDVFVVRNKSQQIEVYDAGTFTLQRCLAVPELCSRPFGLAACPINNCIYASDFDDSIIHRVELSGSNEVMKWSVASKPAGLTVNRAQNLLVVSAGGGKLQEFTTRGTLLQNIQLQSYAGDPWHAIDMANGQFVVSCRGNFHGVRFVDREGTVILSYGGGMGSQMAQMNNPAGLAVDKHRNILVADSWNDRLLVLDSSLTSAHEMSVSVDGGLKDPDTLWYDKSRGRLYISEWGGGRVIVIDHLKDFSTSQV